MNLPPVDTIEFLSCSEVDELDLCSSGEALSLIYLKGRVLSSHSDGSIKLWDARKKALPLVQENHQDIKAVTCLCVGQDSMAGLVSRLPAYDLVTVKCLLMKDSMTEYEAFVLKADDQHDFITFSTFCDALRQRISNPSWSEQKGDTTKGLQDQVEKGERGGLAMSSFPILCSLINVLPASSDVSEIHLELMAHLLMSNETFYYFAVIESIYFIFFLPNFIVLKEIDEFSITLLQLDRHHYKMP